MPGCHVQPEQMFNLIWGYNAIYKERISNTNANAGANFLYGTVVPTGQLWVGASLVGFNVNRSPTAISLGLYDGTTWYNLTQRAGAGAGVTIEWTGLAPLAAGSRFFAYITGCAAGDDIYLDIVGYKMVLTQ